METNPDAIFDRNRYRNVRVRVAIDEVRNSWKLSELNAGPYRDFSYTQETESWEGTLYSITGGYQLGRDGYLIAELRAERGELYYWSAIKGAYVTAALKHEEDGQLPCPGVPEPDPVLPKEPGSDVPEPDPQDPQPTLPGEPMDAPDLAQITPETDPGHNVTQYPWAGRDTHYCTTGITDLVLRDAYCARDAGRSVKVAIRLDLSEMRYRFTEINRGPVGDASYSQPRIRRDGKIHRTEDGLVLEQEGLLLARLRQSSRDMIYWSDVARAYVEAPLYQDLGAIEHRGTPCPVSVTDEWQYSAWYNRTDSCGLENPAYPVE